MQRSEVNTELKLDILHAVIILLCLQISLSTEYLLHHDRNKTRVKEKNILVMYVRNLEHRTLATMVYKEKNVSAGQG